MFVLAARNPRRRRKAGRLAAFLPSEKCCMGFEGFVTKKTSNEKSIVLFLSIDGFSWLSTS